MKSIFEETSYHELLKRIDALSENSNRLWGKMSVGQMVWHCQFPLVIGIKNKNEGNGNILAKLFFKKSMYNDIPFRKNLPTASKLKAKMEKDFDTERQALLQSVIDFYECRTRTHWNPHPLFGKLTYEQWGKMQYKHLNHHLTQFGV